MSEYRVPVRDIQFVLFELLDFANHYQSLEGGEEATPDLVNAIVGECSRFCENILAPLNATGDVEGCHWQDGQVTTPKGFKEAYRQFIEAGWPGLAHDAEHGGQGLPESMGFLLDEMVGTANWAWAMYVGLSHGATKTLALHGNEEQKRIYLSKLVEGTWSGTMCLTEAHCGTDLGMLRTRAEPNGDDSYKITGTKIFISSGEHDLTENIVHIVLARLPDAPEGTKGISLFLVPKFLPGETGLGARNAVTCGGIEEKMGIHGNATCVLNFDGARGFLVGTPNRGLSCMFTFMNTARLGTAVQGLASAELGFQKSLAYSRERLQGRALSGTENPAGPADPIIAHADIRRMLLTQKAFAEGGRMFISYCSRLVDIEGRGQDKEARQEASRLLALLTPIAKAFLTETGNESAYLALQCFGGHGYIRESGVEQNQRDARIATIYEGTTGVQAMDLLGRKVLLNDGELLQHFTGIINDYCEARMANTALAEFVQPLATVNREWRELTAHLGAAATADPDEMGAAAVDYLMYSGYVVLAYLWALAAEKSLERKESGEAAFYTAKLTTARFYYQRLLPRTQSLKASILAGAFTLMCMEAEDFRF